MKYFVFALMAVIFTMLSISIYAGLNEPHWADVVKVHYPYWKDHYWVDRELWGNRGYLVGGPARMLDEDEGFGAMDIEPVVIKEEPLKISKKQLKEKPASHVVKKGECLWYIAGYDDIYGNPLKWPLIYKANKNKIKDPDLIYPGQEFEIPRN